LLYILWGQDDFSIGEKLSEIKGGIGDQSLLAADIIRLDGQQVTPDQLRNVCHTLPFLAARRLVIVDGLLGRFEPKVRPGHQPRTTKTPDQKSDYKSFSTGIAGLPDSTILVLTDGKITKSNPLFRELSSQAEVKSFPLLKNDKLRWWIERRVKQEGGRISPQAVDLLVRFIGGNLWIMANEINKLVLFTSGRCIEEEDVKAVVSYAQQANVFALVDAILEFKVGLAERLLQQSLQQGLAPSYLLFMLSRQVRMLVLARELTKEGKSDGEIQDRLGLTLEFAYRKTLDQASKYSIERLKGLYHKLLEADLSIKTGKYQGELALNLLIAELCRQHTE